MELLYSCPFCNDFKISGSAGPKLYVNEEKQVWFCFHCDRGGKLTADIKSRLVAPVKSINYNSRYVTDLSKSYHIKLYPYFYSEKVRKYVEGRIPRESAYRLRLMNRTDKFVAFIGQDFINMRDIRSKRYFNYGQPKATLISHNKNIDTVVIVEGIFDAGYVMSNYNVVITFGIKKPNFLDILDLSDYVNIILAYDRDFYYSDKGSLNKLLIEEYKRYIENNYNRELMLYIPFKKDICEDKYKSLTVIDKAIRSKLYENKVNTKA
jgi:hypothetical protein